MANPALGALKTAYRVLKQDVVQGTLLYPYGLMRHRALVRSTARSQRHTYTCFYRSPDQLEALCGPVLDAVLGKSRRGPLEITVFASSTGAEPYTLASVLRGRFPELDFRITASDLHEEMIERGRAAFYSEEDVRCAVAPAGFLEDTFERVEGGYRVRPELRERVTFQQASLLDTALATRFPPADLVFAQNVFCHLDEAMSLVAFDNVSKVLKTRSALFLEGMDLGLRERLTAEAGLAPLDFKCREIHEMARLHIDARWWNYYYGLEPYVFWRPNRLRRYGTIFLKGAQVT